MGQKMPTFAASKATFRLRKSGLLKNRYKKMVIDGHSSSMPRKHGPLVQLVSFERFTFRSCLILVFVSLRQLGFPVVLSDILRCVID